ncbi:MAG TPA: DUF169 domain-containing protein [Candidatus Methanomethylophilaceae archaeon]|nr:DUF169 domain-containing protein [Candidatus Methanomethylophilaceae archaeon]
MIKKKQRGKDNPFVETFYCMKEAWPKISTYLQDDLRLRGDAVGIRFIKDTSDISSLSCELLKETAVCHMILRARYDGSKGITAADANAMRCVWGASAMGLIRTPPRLRNGLLYLGFVADCDTGRRMHSRMGIIGDDGKEYKMIEVFPLSYASADPDVIVIYGSPGQMLRLIIAYNYMKGEGICNPVTGQASVCASIARAQGKGETSLDVPCMGDRMYGLVADDEMVFVTPASSMESVVHGLKATRPLAPYPFRPNTNSVLEFPPHFIPDKTELE